MKIAVVGAGAMGCLFGGLLQQAGQQVWLVDLWQEHVERIINAGLIVRTGQGQTCIKINATTDIADVGEADLIIIFVKAYSTAQAAANALRIIGKNTFALTLQNGIGNVEAIGDIMGYGRVVAGTTSYGATLLEPGCVYYAGSGQTYLGELTGITSARIKSLTDIFNAAGIKTLNSQEINTMLWTKLIVNAGINALSAVTAVQNGKLLDYPELTSIMEEAVQEAAAVAAALNIKLADADLIDTVKTVALKTAANSSSMAQDVIKQRRTEIDYINGAIVRAGQSLNIATPVNRILFQLVKALERKYAD